jgi:hypothetical protein
MAPNRRLLLEMADLRVFMKGKRKAISHDTQPQLTRAAFTGEARAGMVGAGGGGGFERGTEDPVGDGAAGVGSEDR